MSWNNRIMKHTKTRDDGTVTTEYGLHEVYYKGGKIAAWTQNSMCGLCESPKELIISLMQMLKDAWRSRHAVLDYDMEPEASFLDAFDEEFKP